MKKKHELIKHAYDNYPKGTKFMSVTTDTELISSGQFEFTSDGRIIGTPRGTVYSPEFGKWAEIVKPSILDGNVAIQINNEREFKLLMEHYHSKGWKWERGEPAMPITDLIRRQVCRYYYKTNVMYKDRFLFNVSDPDSWTFIPFSVFAEEVGIEVPKFIMVSEDGVDLYEGDEYFAVSNDSKIFPCTNLTSLHTVVIRSEVAKAFSTKEAAEAWIAEHNKPKEIRLKLDGGEAIISKDKIRVHLDCENGNGYYIEATEIEPIYAAYKSLQ